MDGMEYPNFPWPPTSNPWPPRRAVLARQFRAVGRGLAEECLVDPGECYMAQVRAMEHVC